MKIYFIFIILMLVIYGENLKINNETINFEYVNNKKYNLKKYYTKN